MLKSLRNCETMESWKMRLRAVSGSFVLRSWVVRELHARASVEQQSRETRETRAAAREASPVSRLQQCAWSFSCVAPFARRTAKKERLLLVYEKLAILSLKPRSHFRILLYQTWAISKLSAVLKLRVSLGPPNVELHHGLVLETLSLLLLAGSEFTSPSPAPFPPSPSPMGAIRHNKAQD